MWDTIFLLPSGLVAPFRRSSMRVARSPQPKDCLSSGRQKQPELPLWLDLRRGRLLVERLPLPCVVGRQDPHRTVGECPHRLQSHALCVSHPHGSADNQTCWEEATANAKRESRQVAEQFCVPLRAALYTAPPGPRMPAARSGPAGAPDGGRRGGRGGGGERGGGGGARGSTRNPAPTSGRLAGAAAVGAQGGGRSKRGIGLVQHASERKSSRWRGRGSTAVVARNASDSGLGGGGRGVASATRANETHTYPWGWSPAAVL